MATKAKKRGTGNGYMVSPKPMSYKPSFTLSETDLPAIKGWEVGKKYNIDLEVEMISHSKGESYGMEAGSKHEARFRIINVDSDDEQSKLEK